MNRGLLGDSGRINWDDSDSGHSLPVIFPIPKSLCRTETETNKKWFCIGLRGVVHTAQRQMRTQIPIRFCVLVRGICFSLSPGLGSISVNATSEINEQFIILEVSPLERG